jgi:hypothetical protein
MESQGAEAIHTVTAHGFCSAWTDGDASKIQRAGTLLSRGYLVLIGGATTLQPVNLSR